MSEMKIISKKNQIEKTENQCQNAACEQKTTREKGKFGSNKKLGIEWTMHLLRKPFRKQSLARKRIFVQTQFSHSTLKLERNFTPQNHSLFRSTSCFGVTKFTTPIWLQKWKFVNRSLKKTAPQYNSNSLNCKKHSRKGPDVQFKEFSLIKQKN